MNGEQLLSEHDQLLSGLARQIAKRYGAEQLTEDLKQEGALAVLDAAKRYAPESGANLKGYIASAARNAMLDYAARNCLPLAVPPKRVRLLRKVASICAQADDAVLAIQNDLAVSERVALALLEEYRALFFSVLLDESTCSVDSPEKAYERKLLTRHLNDLLETELTARERSVLSLHLGLSGDGQKTFAEIAILLNYNGPGAAQKVYDRATSKLRGTVWSGEYGAWIAAKAAVRVARYGMGVNPQ